MVDAKVAADRGDGGAVVVHPSGGRSDSLVDRARHDSAEFSLERKLGDGAKPLRTRPPLLGRLGVTNTTRPEVARATELAENEIRADYQSKQGALRARRTRR